MKRLIGITLVCSALVACGGDDNDEVVMPTPMPEPDPAPVMLSFDVTVTNLTAAQSLSPVAVMLTGDMPAWQIGEPASEPLMTLAEGGDNAALLGLDSVVASASSESPVAPGESSTVRVEVEEGQMMWLTVATMLVNTNDAFTGITSVSLADMAGGDELSFYPHTYDAGTEINSEMAGTIPGPADGGEGVSEGREGRDTVAVHSGVVSAQDGLTGSVLQAVHRFDNPAVHISVTRVE